MAGRNSRRSKLCGASLACPGVRAKPKARPRASASAWALVPKPPWLRPSASLVFPFYRPGCLLVRPDDGAIHEDQAQFGPACRLGTLKEAFPDAELGPAQEGLGRHPPRAQLGWDGAPLGAVLHAPDDGLKGPA